MPLEKVREQLLPVMLQAWLLVLFLMHFFAIKIAALPRWTYGLVELLSAAVLVLLLVYWRDWWARVSRAWLCLLAAGVVLAVIGCTLNAMDPLAAFNGLRRYFRFLPFALLPWLWGLMHVSWQRQAGLLLVLLLLQLPLALLQRLSVELTVAPGDHVVGTLGSPAFLTIVMLCAVSVLSALWLHGRVRPVLALIAMSLVFLPCTLNESKAVLILLPMAVLLPWVFSFYAVSWRRGALLLIWLLGALAVFFPVYDHFNYSRWGYTLWEFLFERDRLAGYLDGSKASDLQVPVGGRDSNGNIVKSQKFENNKKVRQAREQGVRGTRPPGKFNSMYLAWRGLKSAPALGVFGYGAGSTSLSRLDNAQGKLARKIEHQKPDSTTVSQVSWELGWSGLAWLLLVGCYIGWQALRLLRAGGSHRWVGSATLGVLGLCATSLLHKNLIDSAVIWGLFWYLSAWVVLLAHAPGDARVSMLHE